MNVELIASTVMSPLGIHASLEPDGVEYDIEDVHGSDLAEFAGRQCYVSFDRPNPATATNLGYIGNIIRQRHFSVLEHAVMTVRITRVSRSLTHELVRHRHFSYSQLSQRFVTVSKTTMIDNIKECPFIVPPLFEYDPVAGQTLSAAWDYAVHAYDRLMTRGEKILRTRHGLSADEPLTPTMRKQIKEASRAVLPNMTPTAIVVTGNARAWREFLVKRGSLSADVEIRRLAIMIHGILRIEEPAMFQDIDIMQANTPEAHLVEMELDA